MNEGGSIKASGHFCNTEDNLLVSALLCVKRRAVLHVSRYGRGYRNSVSEECPLSTKTGVCCQIFRMDAGVCTSDIYSDEKRILGDLLLGKCRKKCSSWLLFLFPLCLDFSIWIKQCVDVGRQRRDGENARRGKDVLHLSIQSVVFSNFEMKEKNADRIAARSIRDDCKAEKSWIKLCWIQGKVCDSPSEMQQLCPSGDQDDPAKGKMLLTCTT